jgi:putative Mg2+ transporter-C (MgtC) family protein
VVTERESEGRIEAPTRPGDVGVAMTISGTGILRATRVLATVDGVSAVKQIDDEAE